MSVSQKCQYALRAVFELAKRHGPGPTTIGDIAAAQAIPPRFLELILAQLRQGGFVESRRGVHGGYLLAAAPGKLTVGQIIRFVDGPIAPVQCTIEQGQANCPLHGKCAFMGMWGRARDAISNVYDQTTFDDLLAEELAANDKYVASYCI